MGLADLHIHSIHSFDGTATISAILKYVADHTGLDVIAITDHDSVAGVREAKALAPRYGVEVIAGCEVSTAEGHLLALFIDRPIQAGLSYLDTIRAVKAQGGVCVAAHPTAWGANSVTFEGLREMLRQPGVQGGLVGVEAFNAGLVYSRHNRKVSILSAGLPLAQVGNSDAHFLRMIGHGSSIFAGRSAADLRRALDHAETAPQSGDPLGGLAVIRDYLPRFLLRKLGWADWNAAPEAPLSLARLSQALASDAGYETNPPVQHDVSFT